MEDTVLGRLALSAKFLYRSAMIVFTVALIVHAMVASNEDRLEESLCVGAGLLLIEGLRRWAAWVLRPKVRRPSPAANFQPEDIEEAGPRTTAWVEEKLRQARR